MNAIRDAELCNEKPPKALHLDANRTGLIVKDEETTAALSLDSNLALYQAMMRDSCYYGSCWLASYTTVQRWNERLFRIMSQDPPPEYQRVSRAQILRADRQSFLELARVCNRNLKPGSDGSLPLDKEFDKLEFNTSVMYFLLPVRGGGKGGGRDKPGKPRKRKDHEADPKTPARRRRSLATPLLRNSRACTQGHQIISRFASTTTWGSAKLERNASSSVCAASLAVTKLTRWATMISRVHRVTRDVHGRCDCLCSA